MILTQHSSITEEIINTLAEGALSTLDLLAKLQKKEKITKQGFYKALRDLVKKEIVVKNKQLIFLNNVWVNKLHQFVRLVDENYQSSQSKDSFINLEEGDSLTYRFKSIASLDALWMHYFFLIAKKEGGDVLFFNPHDWFSLIRPETQSFMYSWLNDNKRRTYIVIGNNSDLDRKTTEYIKSECIELAYENKISFREVLYSTVIGDYVIDTIIDQNTAKAIHGLYAENKVWNKQIALELEIILSTLKHSKIIITRNKKRAEFVRKKLMKYFIFYKK